MPYSISIVVPDGASLDATIATLLGDHALVGTLVTDTISIAVL